MTGGEEEGSDSWFYTWPALPINFPGHTHTLTPTKARVLLGLCLRLNCSFQSKFTDIENAVYFSLIAPGSPLGSLSYWQEYTVAWRVWLSG